MEPLGKISTTHSGYKTAQVPRPDRLVSPATPRVTWRIGSGNSAGKVISTPNWLCSGCQLEFPDVFFTPIRTILDHNTFTILLEFI